MECEPSKQFVSSIRARTSYSLIGMPRFLLCTKQTQWARFSASLLTKPFRGRHDYDKTEILLKVALSP